MASRVLMSNDYPEEVSESEDEELTLTEEVTNGSKCDVYWLMAIRVLHLADNKEFKAHKVEYLIGMAHSISVYVLTLCLQLTITAFLMLAATRIEHEYHETFFETTKMKLVDATAMMNDAVSRDERIPVTAAFTADNKAGIMKECVHQLRVRYEWIYAVMIFIWILNMLIELKDVTKDVSCFWGMPRLQKGGRIFKEDGKTVAALSPGARAALLITGPGVRCFVAVLLLFAGCKVLLFRGTMMLVVLCSMSLLFVVSLDDLMMNALSGPATKKELGDLSFVYTKTNTRLHSYWIGGLSGLTHMFLCIALAAFYVYVVENEVMNFRNSCWAYYNQWTDPAELTPHSDMMTFSQMFSAMYTEALRGFLYK